jgi:hypothetical protein
MTAFCDAAAQFHCANEDSGRRRQRRTMPVLFLMLSLFCMIAAASCVACEGGPKPSLAAVDEALSKHTLSSPVWDKAMELRAKMAELLSQNNASAAAATEAQIMDIMSLKRPGTRCRLWPHKRKPGPGHIVQAKPA